MDTQGTDDNEMKDDDEVILKKAFKQLHDNQIHNVKLVWIVSGDMDRERDEYSLVSERARSTTRDMEFMFDRA